MINLVSLIAAALVSLQCCHAVSSLIDSKNSLDNNLQPNVVPVPKRRFKSFLNILEPPPETATLIAGSRLVLKCEVLGKPSPTVQWLKNGEPLLDYEESSNEIFSVHPSSLTRLTSKLVVTEASRGDEFTCIATSGNKQRMATAVVYTVEGDDNVDMLALQSLFHKPSSPVITFHYNDVFQNIGTAVVLPCRVYSSSNAQVYWTDNEDKIIYGNPKMKVLSSGDLLISKLDWEDMGNFSCTAKNKYGKDSIKTFVYPLKVKT